MVISMEYNILQLVLYFCNAVLFMAIGVTIFKINHSLTRKLVLLPFAIGVNSFLRFITRFYLTVTGNHFPYQSLVLVISSSIICLVAFIVLIRFPSGRPSN